MGHIAEWYGVRASDIRNWNDIAYGSHIYPGQKLDLWIDPPKAERLRNVNTMSFAEKQSMIATEKTPSGPRVASVSRGEGWIQYKVRSGDTLEKIARDHNVTIRDLQSWNRLRGSRIYAGQSIDIMFDLRSEGNDQTPGQ
jgi:membrane-bound lytic murein transglycosylase D